MDALELTTPPKSWILSGKSGCGKTLLSRLLVKELGYSDVVNIDTIDLCDEHYRTSILNSVLSHNTCSTGQAYIVDDCDFARTQDIAWIADLVDKLQGDSVVIFCTPEARYLPSSLIDKCEKHVLLEFPGVDEMHSYVEDICEYYKVMYDSDGIDLLVGNGNSSVRCILNMLQDVLRVTGNVTYDSVEPIVGNLDSLVADLDEEEF